MQRPLILLLTALALTAVPAGRAAELAGKITAPENGARVPRAFAVEGTVSGSPRNLWLVERIGGQHWPKEPRLVPKDGRWTG